MDRLSFGLWFCGQSFVEEGVEEVGLCLIFWTQLLQYMTHPEVHHLVIEILLITQAVDIRVIDSDGSVQVVSRGDEWVMKKSEIQKHPFLIFLSHVLRTNENEA